MKEEEEECRRRKGGRNGGGGGGDEECRRRSERGAGGEGGKGGRGGGRFVHFTYVIRHTTLSRFYSFYVYHPHLCYIDYRLLFRLNNVFNLVTITRYDPGEVKCMLIITIETI